MGNYMEIIAIITISLYVAQASGTEEHSTLADSPVYWVYPSPSSKVARIYLETSNEPIYSDDLRISTNDVVKGRARGGEKGPGKGPKGSKKGPPKVSNSEIPGAGFTNYGLDTKRACANAYFTKNLIYSMITTLEYQKQMAMMLQTMIEGGQISSGGTSSSTEEASSMEQTSTTTTTTSTTTTTTTTESTTTTQAASTISPETIQELISLLTDILQILPDLLAQFAALEEHVYGTNPAADELIESEHHSYEVTDEKQEAIDRLSILERTLRDTDLQSYTQQLAQSTDLLVRIIEQTMHDITVLAPTDVRVKFLMSEFESVSNRYRWKKF